MKKNHDIRSELKALHSELASVREQIELISRAGGTGEYLVPAMLKQRGFRYLKGAPREQLLIPSECGELVESELYEYLKKYSK